MIGRGAYGRPWQPGRIAGFLASGRRSRADPPDAEQAAVIGEHYEMMLAHYGRDLGLRNARKHLVWVIEDRFADRQLTARRWRQRLCGEDDPRQVLAAIAELFAASAVAEAA